MNFRGQSLHFSKHWTAEERLRLVIILTTMIRDDINNNRYSVPGRPNIQSVHEMIAATAEELESWRESLERMIAEDDAAMQAHVVDVNHPTTIPAPAPEELEEPRAYATFKKIMPRTDQATTEFGNALGDLAEVVGHSALMDNVIETHNVVIVTLMDEIVDLHRSWICDHCRSAFDTASEELTKRMREGEN